MLHRYADKVPNELHIQLLNGKDLPVMDKALLIGTGSSDPFVKFECLGASAKSSIKKKNLNPEWNESFVLNVDDPSAILEVCLMLCVSCFSSTISSKDEMFDVVHIFYIPFLLIFAFAIEFQFPLQGLDV